MVCLDTSFIIALLGCDQKAEKTGRRRSNAEADRVWEVTLHRKKCVIHSTEMNQFLWAEQHS